MITGKKTALQYTTTRGNGANRSNILTYIPDPENRKQHIGKLSVTAHGYRYEPSGAYKRALNKFHAVPKQRTQLSY